MTKLFTSDWHCSHKNILKWADRSFPNIKIMEDHFFENLANMYKPGDILYYLGDVVLSNRTNCIRVLDRFYDIGIRNMHFIFGNHDYNYRNSISNHKVVGWSGDLKITKVQDKSIMLCHYPMRAWRVPYMLHGHSHGFYLYDMGQEQIYHNTFDVGIDAAYMFFKEYRPFTEEDVLNIMICFNKIENNDTLIEVYENNFLDY